MENRNLIPAIFVCSFFSAGTAAAQDFPANEVKIKSVSYSGTGCQQGTVASNLSPDGMALTFLFADYIVESESRGGRPARKFCDLNLQLQVPAGWSYSVLGKQIRGYASVEAGATAAQGTTTKPERGRERSLDVLKIDGPFDGDYENFTEVPFSNGNWSGCHAQNQLLNLKTFISVRPKNGFTNLQGNRDTPQWGSNFPKGMITVDSVDNSIDQTYTLSWKRCDETPGQRSTYQAACRIVLPRRHFAEKVSNDNPDLAKVQARQKVIQTCRLGVPGRQADRICREKRILCSLVQSKQGAGGGGRPGGGGGGRPGGGGGRPGR